MTDTLSGITFAEIPVAGESGVKSSPTNANTPKRRGRPPGSTNKTPTRARKDYKPIILDGLGVVAGLIEPFNEVDSAIVTHYSEKMAESWDGVAQHNEKFAKFLDGGGETAVWASAILTTAGLGLAIAANHGMLRNTPFARMMGNGQNENRQDSTGDIHS